MKGLLLSAIFFLFLVAPYVWSQIPEQRRVNPEYLALDIAGVKAAATIKPIDKDSLPILEKEFKSIPGYSKRSDKTNLGFGAYRTSLAAAFGTVTVHADVLVFHGKIAYSEFAIDGSTELPSEQVMTAWKENGGQPLQKGENKYYLQRDFEDVLASYKATVAAALGKMRTVSVDSTIKDAYTLLTSPLKNSSFSDVACDDGRPAMDLLVKARRTDLIENVLRGYNPGGRIYAVITLLRMQKKGKRLSPATRRTIHRVIRLDSEASTCWGDVGTSGLRAGDIVRRFVN